MNLTTKWTYKPGKVYELTIAPDDKHQFIGKKDTRLKNTVDFFTELLFEMPFNYHLFCEVSHPQFGDINSHRYARIHWHGIVCFNDEKSISQFLLNDYHKLTSVSRIQFNEYRESEWDKYCRKQKEYLPRWTRLKCAAWDTIKRVTKGEGGDGSTPPPTPPKKKNKKKPNEVKLEVD